MKIPSEEDPGYHPEPIDHLDPKTMELKEIERYMPLFDKEVGEINEIQETGTAKDYTKAKMNRRNELEDKFADLRQKGGTDWQPWGDPKGLRVQERKKILKVLQKVKVS